MPKLSVCIICKNEQSRIEACLSSVSWADEIVLLDSGSTDKTLELAAKYTNKIFTNLDWPGFGIQKGLAAERASHDWVLSIDCDEIVTDSLRDEILTELDRITPDQVIVLNRLTHFCDQFVYHSGWHPDPIVRIYNKKKYSFNSNLVHESVDCGNAPRIQLKSKLQHYTFEGLDKYLAKRNGYAKIWAEERFKKGKSASSLKALSSAAFAFIRHYILRLGFLDGRVGLLISVIQMQYSFNKYMMLALLSDKKDE